MKLLINIMKSITYYILLYIKKPFNIITYYLQLLLVLGTASIFFWQLDYKYTFLYVSLGLSFTLFLLKKFYDKILYWLNPEYKSLN